VEYPRNYYKCTEEGCNVKKQVEQRGSSFVTTYEGTHNHTSPELEDEVKVQSNEVFLIISFIATRKKQKKKKEQLL
jgi:hypothetical protein